jgi:hypothetical protein
MRTWGSAIFGSPPGQRLRTHGLIKKIGRTYKYYVTRLGQRILAGALKLRRLFLIPAIAEGSAT